MNTERKGGWITTASGGRFWPLDPRVEDVQIEDIAHQLSNVCRFSGATSRHYSVGEHSIRVALICPPEDMLWGLLHDASEAYLHDIPRPLKVLPEFAFYREAEERLMAVICERFGLSKDQPDSVTRADKILLKTEGRDLMPESFPKTYYPEVEALEKRIRPLGTDSEDPSVEDCFIDMFHAASGDGYFNDPKDFIESMRRCW